MTKDFSAKEFLSLLTCSTRREVCNIVNELTNGFDEYLSKLVLDDIKETSRTCQIGKCVSPFITALHNVRSRGLRVDVSEVIDVLMSRFDYMTGATCCNTLTSELYYIVNNEITKDDNELYYTFGKICIDKSNSTPFSFRLKECDKFEVLLELSIIKEKGFRALTQTFEELGTVEIDDIEPPRGLTFAMEILENRPLVKDKTVNSEPATLETILPDELKTGEAIKYFKRAIDNGFMEQKNNGYKWTFGGKNGQVRLGYFCSKILQQPRPIATLEKLFGVSKLDASIYQAENNEPKRADVKQWRKQIDDVIFFD